MPNISFSFTGWISAARVTKVLVVKSMLEIDVSDVDANELADKLNSGEWAISLSDHLDDNRSSEVEMFDFEAGIN